MLEFMDPQERGRLGGLRGGRARAEKLTPSHRATIARQAAEQRWKAKPVVLDRSPRGLNEMMLFVANYASPVSLGELKSGLERVVLGAVDFARDECSLARMLPVFLWRVRDSLSVERMATMASAQGPMVAAALGYFCQLTSGLGGGSEKLDDLTARLRVQLGPSLPRFVFFHWMKDSPVQTMVAEQRNPPEASSWGLLTGTPTDSFSSYFAKMVRE